MIPIKINGKKYSIKHPHELLTSEYVELSKIFQGLLENEDDKVKAAYQFVIRYISWSAEIDLQLAYFSKISDSLVLTIGTLFDQQWLMPKTILGKPVKRYIIDTVGQRFMIETCNKKGYELLIFVCAVALARSEDYTVIESIEQRLMRLPYQEVIPIANFFFQHLRNGKNSGASSLGRFIRWIKTRLSVNRRVKKT